MPRGPVATPTLTVSAEAARRLTIERQLLSGPRPTGSGSDLAVAVARALGFVQWDPVTVVAPSHLIAFWSRMGELSPASLDRLLWRDRRLFLHWMPIASLVPTGDYAIHGSLMHRYPDSLSPAWGAARVQAKRFLRTHEDLRRTILRRLREGPSTVREFAPHAATRRRDVEWVPSSDVAQLLAHLHMKGEVMVVGHQGNQNLWGLTEGFLPSDTDRTILPRRALEERMAERAFRALGVATPRDVKLYYVRGRYQDVAATIARLDASGRLRRVRVAGWSTREPTFVLADEVDHLHQLEDAPLAPRMSLIPPFDTLLTNIERTRRVFGFEYVREQFLPPARRRFGTYVLPIVWGDRLIGRVDPKFDPTTRTLRVHAVHAETGAPRDRATGARVQATIVELARHLGATEVTYSSKVPKGWGSELR